MVQRQEAINNISKGLAFTRMNLEHRQAVSDYSLNIYGENFFRDVFNHIFNKNFVNANFETKNAASIDLIDKNKRCAYQITTTVSLDKIRKTLKFLKKKEFSDFDIKIFYLLEKPRLKASSKKSILTNFNVKTDDILRDYTDLMITIENLDTPVLLKLDTNYFQNLFSNYSDEVVLDLVIRNLLKDHDKINVNNRDDFSTLAVDDKIKINNLHRRNELRISEGLDYQVLLLKMENNEDTISLLREFIVNDLYHSVLITNLLKVISSSALIDKTLQELHEIAVKMSIDFNVVLADLYEAIKKQTIVDDFNSMNIIWIIISHFFEICDVGRKIKDDPAE